MRAKRGANLGEVSEQTRLLETDEGEDREFELLDFAHQDVRRFRAGRQLLEEVLVELKREERLLQKEEKLARRGLRWDEPCARTRCESSRHQDRRSPKTNDG